MGEQTAKAPGLNRAKTYQLVLFPLNNGATNVYYVLVLSYIATFGSKVLALSMIFASVMVTGMRLFDAITDPIIGALMDRTNGKFGKFRPFMVIGNLIMAASILVLYCLTPLIPASSMFLRYAAFVALYAVWVIGYTFQTSCTRSGQTVLTNDPKQRPLFTIFNTVGSLLGMGAMQFFAPILAKNYEGGYASAGTSTCIPSRPNTTLGMPLSSSTAVTTTLRTPGAAAFERNTAVSRPTGTPMRDAPRVP